MEEQARAEAQAQEMQFQHEAASALESQEQPDQGENASQPFVRDGKKVGRNDPCPCGSGKKYKQCHGKLA